MINFTDDELLDLKAKCNGDPLLTPLLAFYLSYGQDGIGIFMRGLNNGLKVFGKKIEELQDIDFDKLTNEGERVKYESLMSIAKDGAALAKQLKELQKVRVPIAKKKVGDDSPDVDEEEPEEMDERSYIDRFADRNQTK